MLSTLAAVAAVGAWRYAGSTPGRIRLAALVQKQAAAAIPGLRVHEVGRDRGDLLAAGVDIWDADGRRAVHVDRVRVRPHWTSLLHRRVWIEELRIEGVRVLGRAAGGDTSGGPLNLATLVAPRERNQPAKQKSATGDHLPVPVRVDRIIVVDAAADIWAGGDTSHVTIGNLSFQGRVDSAGQRTTAAVQQVAIVGDVDQRSFSVAGAVHGGIDHRAIDVVVDALNLGGLTPAGEVALRAGASGDLGALKIWLTGTGPAGATAAASGSVGLATQGLGPYDVHVTVDAPVLTALVPSAPAGGVSLRARARGHGTPLQPGSQGEVTLYVPPSTIAGHPLSGAYVHASAMGAAWTLEPADLHAPGIRLRAEGSGDGPRVQARLTGDVSDAGAVRRTAGLRKPTAAPAVPARGRGHLEAAVEGRTDGKLTFTADGHARALTAATWGRLLAADLSLRGAADNQGGGTWMVTARTSGRVQGLDGPTVSLAEARFQGAASVVGGGRGAQAMQLGQVAFDGTRLRVGTTAFDQVHLRARADRTGISLSANAAGRAGTAVVAAHGQRRPDRIDVTVDRIDLALAPPGPRERLTLVKPATVVIRPGQEVQLANFEVNAQGELLAGRAAVAAVARLSRPPAGAPWARADVALDKLTTAGIPPVTGNVHVIADGRRGRADVALRMGASTFTASLDVPAPIRSSLGELRPARTGQVNVALDSKNLDLASLPPLQRALARHGLVGGKFTVHATVTGDIAEPDAKLALDVRAIELRDVTGEGRDAVIHTIPGIGASVQVATGRNKVEASGKLLLYSAGVASFSGTLGVGLGPLLGGADPGQAPIVARVDIPRFQINALKSLSDELRDTRGWLAGTATVGGTVALPRAQVDLSVSDVHVDRLSVGKVVLRASTDGRTLQATAQIQDGGTSGSLTATTQLSLGATHTLNARVDARGFNPGVVRPFLTGVRELDAVVDAQIHASGAWPGVRLDGRLYAYRGRLGVIGQPTFRDVGLAVAMRPGRIDLEKLQMFSGDGSLEATGWVTLDGLQPRGGVVKGNANRFTIAAAGVSGARLDGAWAVEIARRESVLGGKVDIPHAAIWLPKVALGGRKPQRITPHDDVRFVDGASRAAEARQRAEANGPPPLAVNVEGKARTIYVRGKDMDLELESTVTLKTPPAGGPLQLIGSVRIRRGRINIQGQRFEVGTGAITFDGPPSTPRIDITLSRTYPDARVIVEIHGTPNKPQLRMSSEPPIYDQGQIVSLILTGQAQGRPGAGGSFDPTATIATAVVKKLADKVAPEVGLDVIRIERAKPDGEQATTGAGDFAGRVEVGKYINDRVYVSYAHRFGATDRQNANEASAEYRMSAHWLAETVFGDAGVGGVDAFWIYRY